MGELRCRPLLLLLLLLHLLAGACVSVVGAADAGGNSSAAQPENELNVVWFDWAPCKALERLSASYPLARVNVRCGDFNAWYNTIFDDFKEGRGELDVVILDSQWIGEAVVAKGGPHPYLIELTDLLDEPEMRKEDFFENSLRAYGEFPPRSGRYWGVPFQGDVMFLAYRPSVFNALNIVPPQSLEEILSIADVINRNGSFGHGFTSFWCGNESNAICYDETPALFNQLAWMFGGEIWNETTYQIRGVLDAPENVDALNFMKRLYEAGPRVPDISYPRSIKDMCEGRSAMFMVWMGFASQLIDPLLCRLAHDIAFYPIPAPTTLKKARHILQLGGMGMHINRFSKRTSLAKDYLRWVSARRQQKDFSTLGGYSVRKSVLADPSFLLAEGKCLSHRYVFLQSYPLVRDFWNLAEYNSLLRIQRIALTKALHGSMTAQEALTSIAAQQAAIVDASYPCGPNPCGGDPQASTSSGPKNNTVVIALSVIIPILCLLVLALLIKLYRRRKSDAPPVILLTFPAPDKWEMDPSTIHRRECLGQGQFGEVYRAVIAAPNEPRADRGATSTTTTGTGTEKSAAAATATATQASADSRLGLNTDTVGPDEPLGLVVAVKVNHDPPSSAELCRLLLAEAKTMKKFAEPGHPNVVRLIGTCTQALPLMIVMEYCELGDLHSLLVAENLYFPSKGNAQTQLDRTSMKIIPELQVRFGRDIARGMEYLAQRGFVHRDLATRNCLVSKDLVAKIGDFGLTKDVHYKNYYRKNGEISLPVRWCAPECLMKGLFTQKGDVWSFGVLLWEIASKGAVPYAMWKNQEVMENVVMGFRLQMPENCLPQLYDIMNECWSPERPNFSVLATKLTRLHAEVQSFNTAGLRFGANSLSNRTSSSDSPPVSPRTTSPPFSPPLSRAVEHPQPGAASSRRGSITSDASSSHVLSGAPPEMHLQPSPAAQQLQHQHQSSSAKSRGNYARFEAHSASFWREPDRSGRSKMRRSGADSSEDEEIINGPLENISVV